MNKEISLALVGPGLIGKKHIDLIIKNPASILSAIVAPFENHNIAIAQELNVPLFPNLEALFLKKNTDGIIIASPNIFHYEQGSFCIERKIPILIEKPICDNFEDALKLVKLAMENSSKVLIGHHREHSSIIKTAKNLIKSGKIGKIVSITGSAQFFKPDDYFIQAPWRTAMGGGPILINLIHEIGNLRALCGEIDSVQAFLSNSIRGGDVEDTAAINFKFINGALGTFILSDTAATSRSWEQTSGENPNFHNYPDDDCYLVCGTQGSISIPSMKIKYYNSRQESSWSLPFHVEKIPYTKTDPLEKQLNHFIELIRGDIEPEVTALDGLRNLQVVEAIYNSGHSGTTCKINSQLALNEKK
jgi:predicted dehydrogenase